MRKFKLQQPFINFKEGDIFSSRDGRYVPDSETKVIGVFSISLNAELVEDNKEWFHELVKYSIKKDTPTVKAGTVFFREEGGYHNTHFYTTGGCGGHTFQADVVENNEAWFKLIENE